MAGSAKTTRAERRAKSRERIAAQKAAKEAILQRNEEEAHRKQLRRNVITFAALLVTMPLLALGLITARDTASANRQNIEDLVAANYEVQSVTSIRDTSFIGSDVMVAVNNKMFECHGVTKETLEAKKPLACTGITVQAKP